MQAIILNPEVFIQYKSKIGIMLYSEDNSSQVNFFTGYEHLKLDRSQLETPSLEKIQEAVVSNEHLRELAEDHNLIEIHYNDETEDYLEYYSTFN